MSFALLGVWAFGEAEFWLALLKVLAIAIFFLCAILISSGVIGGQKIGFKYYEDPGPFTNGVKGVFEIFVFAALQYSGTEMIGLTAGESQNPNKDIPKAVKSIIWRIVVIFLGGIFFLTITVPSNDPNLLSESSKTASSPFVIAFNHVGARKGADAVNAVILLTIFSAVNSAVYVGSRTLYGLAKEGAAPKMFLYTVRGGIPIVALVFFHLLGFLSFLNLSSSAGVVYTWVISMTGVATFITCQSYITSHVIQSSLADITCLNRGFDLFMPHTHSQGDAASERFCIYFALPSTVLAIWCLFRIWNLGLFRFFSRMDIVCALERAEIFYELCHRRRFHFPRHIVEILA